MYFGRKNSFVRVVNNILSCTLVPRSYLESQTQIKFEAQTEKHKTPPYRLTLSRAAT